MKANELMIGDWVKHPNGQNRITAIQDNDFVFTDYREDILGACEVDDLQPIPLTPEILEKNGWSYNDEDAKFATETWSGGGLILQGHEDSGFMIMAISDYDDEDTNHTPFILNYVHELQHALKLRRLSKEITIN